jgi:hypothetical protein
VKRYDVRVGRYAKEGEKFYSVIVEAAMFSVESGPNVTGVLRFHDDRGNLVAAFYEWVCVLPATDEGEGSGDGSTGG